MVFFDVFEDHECHSCDFLSGNFLEDFANCPYDTDSRH
jgi:hypothetical protein